MRNLPRYIPIKHKPARINTMTLHTPATRSIMLPPRFSSKQIARIRKNIGATLLASLALLVGAAVHAEPLKSIAVLDFECTERRMRLRSVHPGVTVADVVAATGFELVIPDDVPTSRAPSGAELAALGRLDRTGMRLREVPDPQ